MRIKKTARALVMVLGCLLVITGVSLAVVPYVVSIYLDHKVSSQIEVVEENRKITDHMQERGDVIPCESDGDIDHKETDPLYEAMLSYNTRIYNEGQSGIIDLGTFEALPEELESVADGPIGYIEIPSINVKLPLYVGATNDNMANGAAILSNTSMPIGGENTNCVIAGHRGYYGGKFFKDIESISVGDSVFITNPWETLEYIVEGFDIVLPSDADAIKIREDRELVTLLTCHPYASNGKYRYLVFCAPVGEVPDKLDTGQETKKMDSCIPAEVTNGDEDKAFGPSQGFILAEEYLQRLSILLMGITIVAYIIYMVRRHLK